MRAQTDLKNFFKLFFSELNSYRDVKQGYDDLGSVLSSQQRERDGEGNPVRQREGQAYAKRDFQQSANSDSQHVQEESGVRSRDRKALRPPGYDTHRRLWTPESERREFRPKVLQHLREADEDSNVSVAMQRDMESERDEDLGIERDAISEEPQAINAMDGERDDRRKGCFWKYMYGECTNKECTMDHRDETIQGMWKKRVWDLAKAVKSPGGDILVPQSCKEHFMIPKQSRTLTRELDGGPLCKEDAERSQLSSIQEQATI
jgi:hypothetical protein